MTLAADLCGALCVDCNDDGTPDYCEGQGAPGPESAFSVSGVGAQLWSIGSTWNLGQVPGTDTTAELRHLVELDTSVVVDQLVLSNPGSTDLGGLDTFGVHSVVSCQPVRIGSSYLISWGDGQLTLECPDLLGDPSLPGAGGASVLSALSGTVIRLTGPDTHVIPSGLYVVGGELTVESDAPIQLMPASELDSGVAHGPDPTPVQGCTVKAPMVSSAGTVGGGYSYEGDPEQTIDGDFTNAVPGVGGGAVVTQLCLEGCELPDPVRPLCLNILGEASLGGTLRLMIAGRNANGDWSDPTGTPPTDPIPLIDADGFVAPRMFDSLVRYPAMWSTTGALAYADWQPTFEIVQLANGRERLQISGWVPAPTAPGYSAPFLTAGSGGVPIESAVAPSQVPSRDDLYLLCDALNGTTSVRILRNDGQGGFHSPESALSFTDGTSAMAVGDLTGDGLPDIATVSPTGVSAWKASGAQGFVLWATWSAASDEVPQGVCIIPPSASMALSLGVLTAMNGDGGSTFRRLKVTGTTLIAAESVPIDGTPVAVKSTNWDAIGSHEVIVVTHNDSETASSAVSLLTVSKGSYAMVGQCVGPGRATDLELTDVNGDGWIDAVCSLVDAPSIYGGAVACALNDTSPTAGLGVRPEMAPWGPLVGAMRVSSVDTDLDGDNDLVLVLGANLPESTVIIRNDTLTPDAVSFGPEVTVRDGEQLFDAVRMRLDGATARDIGFVEKAIPGATLLGPVWEGGGMGSKGGNTAGDIDGDGVVGGADLAAVLGNWG